MFTATDTMDEAKAKFFNWFLNQGLGVIALSVFCWLLWQQQVKANDRAEMCNSKILELYQTQTSQLVEVLDAIQQKLPDAAAPDKRKK